MSPSATPPATATAATPDTEEVEPARRPSRTGRPGLLSRYVLVLVLAVLLVVFSVLRPATFPTSANIIAIITSQQVLVVLAVGLLFPLVAGEFDLSVGYTLGFSAMTLAVLSGQAGLPLPVALLASLLVGGVVGAINAVLVLRFGVSAFIATLGSGTVLQGLTLWLSSGAVVAGLPTAVSDIGVAHLGGIPYLVFFALLVAVLVHFVLEHTPFGRYLYATGAGRAAARLAGVRTDAVLAIAFVTSGLVAGIAGIMQTAVLGSANPDVGGAYLLPVFAAGFLGATAIKPGRMNVPGTVLALVVLAVGIAGLAQLGAPLWVSPVFNGLALVIAVALAVRRRRSALAGA